MYGYPDEVYGNKNIVMLEENALKYKLGGYHPVALGDVFKDRRYRIFHKLGFGGLSTVWLARDSLYVLHTMFVTH